MDKSDTSKFDSTARFRLKNNLIRHGLKPAQLVLVPRPKYFEQSTSLHAKHKTQFSTTVQYSTADKTDGTAQHMTRSLGVVRRTVVGGGVPLSDNFRLD